MIIQKKNKNRRRIRSFRAVLRILYPERCPMCDALLDRKEPMVCRKCAGKLAIAFRPFPGGFAPFPYSGMYRDSVRRFKYGGRPAYARFYAGAVLAAGRWRIREWRPDCVVPVPVHPARMRERGYNQAEELARYLAAALQIPCRSDLVRRKKNTLPQNALDPEERRKNLHGAFSVRKNAAVPKRVLIVDDIYTTGSTVRELASVLAACGAEEIHAVCVCVALR